MNFTSKVPEYDAATCWTAAEIRAKGFPVDPGIPDYAWVKRADVVFGVGAFGPGDQPGAILGSLTCEIRGIWTWEGDLVIQVDALLPEIPENP